MKPPWIGKGGRQYYSVKTRDAMNRRLYNNQSFVETAIYRVLGMIYRVLGMIYRVLGMIYRVFAI
jgi:hypothetical protein